MFIVSLVSHISFSPNGKCKCVQRIYTWRKMQNKRLCYQGPCCRGWLLLSALLCVVLQLIRRSVVHTKMPNIFIVPPPFKETDGRTAWSQEESGGEACTLTPDCSFCYFHSISSIILYFFCGTNLREEPSSSSTFWRRVHDIWCETEAPPSPPPPTQSSPVWSSHVTFNNSEISLNKQLRRCERTRPPSCGHPCSLWHLGRPEGPNWTSLC